MPHRRIKPIQQRIDPDVLAESVSTFAFKKFHLIAGFIFLVLGQGLTTYISYIKSMSELKQEIAMNATVTKQEIANIMAAMENRVAALRLERESMYVKKEEHQQQMKSMSDKLDKITGDLSVLTGFIQGREGKK